MLELERVFVSYGRVEALRGIDARLAEGELLCLIGANGAGKSTTLKAVAGLVPVRGGRIRFAGENITHLPSHARVDRGVALVPEGREIFPRMTVLENLEVGFHRSRSRGTFSRLLERSYDLFPRLKQRAAQHAGTLSGGEQQMLAIARGLISSPRLLMLDEPSLGLSPLMVSHLATIIRRLHAGGLSILLVEQNARMALQLSSRGYVLETGSVVLHDTAPNLLASGEVQKAYLGM
jgi:branched-chain amino acid transport system ATP-binding protein